MTIHDKSGQFMTSGLVIELARKGLPSTGFCQTGSGSVHFLVLCLAVFKNDSFLKYVLDWG